MYTSSSGAIMRDLVFFAGTDMIQLGDDGRFQATYNCSIISIYIDWSHLIVREGKLKTIDCPLAGSHISK